MIGLIGLKFRKEAFTSDTLDIGPPSLFIESSKITKNNYYTKCAIQENKMPFIAYIFFTFNILTIHFIWVTSRLISNTSYIYL